MRYRRSGNFRVKNFFSSWCYIFVVQLINEKNNDQCVDNGDVRTSCCYAMVLPTDVKAFFWAVSMYPVWPTLLPNFACQFETSRFAEAILRDGTENDRHPLGLGSPCTGLKNRTRAVVLKDSIQIVYTCEECC